MTKMLISTIDGSEKIFWAVHTLREHHPFVFWRKSQTVQQLSVFAMITPRFYPLVYAVLLDTFPTTPVFKSPFAWFIRRYSNLFLPSPQSRCHVASPCDVEEDIVISYAKPWASGVGTRFFRRYFETTSPASSRLHGYDRTLILGLFGDM